MMPHRAFARRLPYTFICAAMLMLSTPAAADRLPSTPVSMGAGLETKEAKNLSGAACAPNGPCLLVGDEMRFARLFTLSPSAAAPQSVSPGQPLFLLPGTELDDPETDVEGVAYAGGSFYIIGSHSRNKTGVLQPARHILYRIPAQTLTQPSPALGTGTAPSAAVQRISLDSIIMAHPFVMPPPLEAEPLLSAPGEGKHGLNIEGIAVRGNDMFLGFRGPVNEAGALILQLDMEALYAGVPQTPRAHYVALPHEGRAVNEQGIRDMATVSNGYLILSGREMRVPPERTDIYFWVPGSAPVHLGQLEASSGSRGASLGSPEAMTVLEEGADFYRVLIMSDGATDDEDASRAGDARIVRIPKPAQ